MDRGGGRRQELAAGGVCVRLCSQSSRRRASEAEGSSQPAALRGAKELVPAESAVEGPLFSSACSIAALHAPDGAWPLAPLLTAPASLGSIHALRSPGVVGCSCPRLRDRRWLRGRGGVNGSPFQLYLHLATARTLCHGGAAHQRWVPAGRRGRGTSGRGTWGPGAAYAASL